MKGDGVWRNVFIHQDLTPREREQRREMMRGKMVQKAGGERGLATPGRGGEPRRAAMRPVELKFLFLNARSIMDKLDDLVVVVELWWLLLVVVVGGCCCFCRPDVIGITETWATAEVLDSELSLDGYVMFREDRKNCAAARGGGVLLCVSESLSPGEFKPVTRFPEHVRCSIRGEEERSC